MNFNYIEEIQFGKFMEPKFYVYVITDPRDSQPFYVGKGCGARMTSHEVAARGNYKDSHLPHHDRIRELLSLGLQPVYHQPFDNLTESSALLKEQVLIQYFGRRNNGTGILLNQSEGGKNHGTSPKPVCQYDLTGEYVAEFTSAKEAGEQTTGNRSYITQCCKGVRKSSGGFQWAYKHAPAPSTYNKQYYRPVAQYTTHNELVDVYPSLTHAQAATGIELHNISEACRGKSATAGGFVWQYVEQK